MNKQKVSEESLRNDLMKLPKKTLVDLVVAGGKNCWSVQNNWMEYIFGKYGNEAAGQADEAVFYKFARSMLYRERKILKIEGNDIRTLLQVYKFFPMQESNDTYITQVGDTKMVIQINSCTMGTQRRKRGLSLLPCKPAGTNFFNIMAKTVNSDAKVACVFCPPDEIPSDTMCKWEIEFPSPRQ